MAIVDTSKVGVPMSSEEENHLFESVPSAYVKALRDEGFPEKKLVVYCSLLREFLLHHGTKTEEDPGLEDFRTYLDRQEGMKVSGGVQSKTREAISLYYEKVLGYGKDELCPVTKDKNDELPEVFSDDELNRLLKATNNAKYKAMISLLYESDLSIDDLSGLRIKDLDLNKNSVEVAGMNGEKVKFLYLNQNSKALLNKYLTLYKPEKWVFERTKDKAQYLPEKILSLVRQFAFKAGLGNMIKPYSLRQSFTKTLKEKGLDSAEIRSLFIEKKIKKSLKKEGGEDVSDQQGWGS